MDELGRKNVIFGDNCSSHTETDAANQRLGAMKIEICKLLAFSTGIIQPAVSFFVKILRILGEGGGTSIKGILF